MELNQTVPKVPTKKEYLTPEDLTLMLTVSINTIRAWRRDQKMPPAFKLGKLIRWKKTDIDQWLKERQE